MGIESNCVVIGMPVYNAARWLAASLECWKAQTWPEFRLVVCDNASTDDSFEICARMAQHDDRIELHRNARNIGVVGNFRRVFELGGKSRFFMWASSHDLFTPDHLRRCLDVLISRSDVVLACGGTALLDGTEQSPIPYDEVGGVDGESAFERFRAVVEGVRLNNFVHGLIRASALRRTRLVEDYYSSDNVLIAELALAGKIVQLPDITFYRRWEPRASTSRMTESERRLHWDPDRRGMARCMYWKMNAGYLRAVLRSSLAPAERRRALTLALKGVYWNRHRLASELGGLIRHAMYRRREKAGA